MTKEIGWNHPVDTANQWDGFNHSGMQHFAGNPIRSLAREIIQNSLDARKTESEPVVVKVKIKDIPVSSIPNLEELKATISLCDKVSSKEGRKAEIFFREAKKQLGKKNVQILEISDHNTHGMKGPSDNGTPFYAFTKAPGQSKKPSDTASGSYGIGKFAPYTVSKLRTIFLSTVYLDDSGNSVQLTQGKSILMSHDVDGDRKQGTGYWGVKERCNPIEGLDDAIPEWLSRASNKDELDKSLGSTLSIVCFDAKEGWKDMLIVSILENYFAAIWDGQLTVEIGDFELNKKAISTMYSQVYISKVTPVIESEKNEPEQFIHSGHYLNAYSKGVEGIEFFEERSQTTHLGLCELRILVGDGLPKKVCALRNGMFITDSLSGLKRFSDFKEFVAVFVCHDAKGNELLRAMEPPRHDDFEVELLTTKEEQDKGRKALREIAKWVKKCLSRHAKDPVSDVTEIDELKDFFGEEGDSDTGKAATEVNPFGEVVIRAKPIKHKVQSVKDLIGPGLGGEHEGEDDGGGGDDGSGGGDGVGGTGAGTGGSGGGGERRVVEIANVRATVLATKQRKISFTPSNTGQVVLQLQEAGADVDYDIGVTNTSYGEVHLGKVKLDVTSGQRVSIDIGLEQNLTGALKVVVYEI